MVASRSWGGGCLARSLGRMVFVAFGAAVGVGPGISLITGLTEPVIVADDPAGKAPAGLRRGADPTTSQATQHEDPELAALVDKVAQMGTLDGPDWEISRPENGRSSEVFALVAQRATPDQMQALLSHPSSNVRLYAMKHVAQNLPDRLGALAPLLDDLEAESPHGGCSRSFATVAEFTLIQLGQRKGAASTETLLRAARDARWLVIRARALAHLQERPEALPQVEALARSFVQRADRMPPAPEGIGEGAHRQAFLAMLKQSIETLGVIDAARYRDLIAPLASHDNGAVRVSVIEFFRHIDDAWGLSTLERMLSDTNIGVAQAAREAYARHPLRDEQRLEAMLQAHPDEERLWAGLALRVTPGSLERWKARAFQQPGLVHEMFEISQNTTDRQAVGATVCSMLERPPSAWHGEVQRDLLLDALGRLGEARCKRHLVAALSVDDEWETATMALARLGDRSIVPGLRKALDGPPLRARTAASALVVLRDRESLPWIERAIERAKVRDRAYLREQANELRAW